MTQIKTWLDFALQQMAAESYLDRFLSGELSLDQVLQLGNNRLAGKLATTSSLLGQTRMTNQQVTEFSQRYQVVSHHANDSTGFSATLMQERDQNGNLTNNFTLSFRSTEYQPQTSGGDRARDGFGADAEISLGGGFAVGQLLAMEDYYQSLKDSGLLPAEATLDVTGYSLGGHLATVFTELHTTEINHTYTFNGAGRGHITGGLPTETTEAARIAGMLALYKQVLFNPDTGLAVLNDSDNVAYNAAKQIESRPFTPFASETTVGGAGSIYSNARYRWAAQVVAVRYQTTRVSFPPGEVGEGPAFSPDKFTQLYGHATQDDSEYVANSGVHGPQQAIYIEDQPNLDGFGGFFGDRGDYGTTHSITLIVDSLATQELFQTVAPTLTQSDIEAIFTASSNQRASGIIGTSGIAEGNSLENALDALGKLFVPNYKSTQSGRQTGDFGSLTFRNPFYQNIASVKTALVGTTVTIEPFVEMGVVDGQPKALSLLTPNQVIAEAQENTDRGLAFRYALRALNPFAVIGADYQGLGHTANGQLTVFDPATGFGGMTDEYLTDRAAFLEAKIELNLLNDQTSGDTIHYQDYATGFEVATGSILSIDREFLFGSDRTDVLPGNSADDHLFGGVGADVLNGSGGNDYLQGDAGDDRLDGDVGSDTLKGGQGMDIYVLNPDGTDTVEDSDRRGVLQVDNQLMVGGIRRTGEAANTYKSSDGQFTFVQNGSNLTINGHVTIQNWHQGDLGIALRDLSALPDGTLPVINYANGQPIVRYDGDATDNTSTFSAAANHEVYGYGGNDILNLENSSAAFNHQIFGGDGHDELHGGSGQDRLYGEAGRDLLTGWVGDDVLDGGIDTDLLKGGLGQDVLYGGSGDDFLDGEAGDDVLFGGVGNDVLSGESPQDGATTIGNDYLDGEEGDDWLAGLRGDDVLAGGSGADKLYGDQAPAEFPNIFFQYPGIVTPLPGQAFTSITGGADYLDGGAGDDYLQGDAGDDVLLGGTENDTLYGDDSTLIVQQGKDWLDGGAGNDNLYGGGGSDTLIGGSGDDFLAGDFTDDPVGGADWLDGGDGNDTLVGGRGDDVLFGGADQDLLFGHEGQDVLDGGRGNDELQGGTGADTLWGGTGDDRLFGDEENDQLLGGEGIDTLVGGEGDDVLVGGVGDDALFGGVGADTYVYNLGDGVDSISDTPGEGNTLVFGPGVSEQDISLGLGSLLVRVGSNGDAIHIEGFNPADPTQSAGIDVSNSPTARL